MYRDNDILNHREKNNETFTMPLVTFIIDALNLFDWHQTRRSFML